MKQSLFYSNTLQGCITRLRAMQGAGNILYSDIHCKRMLSEEGIPTWQLSYREQEIVKGKVAMLY